MDLERFLSFLFLLHIFFITSIFTAAQPLSTDSLWIVDESGRRVKFACVNWPSHLEPVLAEGLSKRPLDEISKEIGDMGFNCVKANNPSILVLSLINAFKAVVASLEKNNVMIILDNHISKPGWCCSDSDGNGFFGDQYFNPDLWIKGLTKVATTFYGTKNVVAMSLRNELRRPKQNIDGAEAVHAANPQVLVILSGLGYDTDLSFLVQNPIALRFSNKTVFKLHWYSFFNKNTWKNNLRRGGFLLDKGYPLFFSEWGFVMKGTNVNDNRYLNCFMGWASEFDVEWAYWDLPGSYYLRRGKVEDDEPDGIYYSNWSEIRNQSQFNKISVLQYPFRGPGYLETEPHKILLHPLTGLCVKRSPLQEEPLILGPCNEAQAWDYTTQETLAINGTDLCLQAYELGKLAKLSKICNGTNSKWEAISDSKMHLSSKLEDGINICLDIDSNENIATNYCKCLNKDNSCDPASQWFKIIDSTRSSKGLFF